MFKEGDKIVCIDNRFESDRLTLYGTYTFNNYDTYYNKKINYNIIYLKENNISWRRERFITIKEYRKQKLEKICLEKEIK